MLVRSLEEKNSPIFDTPQFRAVRGVDGRSERADPLELFI